MKITKIIGIITILVWLVWIGNVIGACIVYKQIKEDILGWREMTYAAADAKQMEMYLDNLLKGMDKWNMHKGHYAVFFKAPDNDVAVDYEVFSALKNRAKEIQKFDKGSMDYAESLEDIRRQAQQTSFNPTTWYIISKCGRLATLYIYFGWIVGVVFILIYLGLKT